MEGRHVNGDRCARTVNEGLPTCQAATLGAPLSVRAVCNSASASGDSELCITVPPYCAKRSKDCSQVAFRKSMNRADVPGCTFSRSPS